MAIENPTSGWGWLGDVIWNLGAGDSFPKQNEDNIRALAAAVQQMADALTTASNSIEPATQPLTIEWIGESSQAFQGSFILQQSNLDSQMNYFDNIADMLMETARDVEYTKRQMINTMIVTIALLVAQFALLPFGGVGSILAAGAVAAFRQAAIGLAKGLVTRILGRTVVGLATRVAFSPVGRFALHAGEELLEEAIEEVLIGDLLTQWQMNQAGTADGYDFDKTKAAAVGAAVGVVAAIPVGRAVRAVQTKITSALTPPGLEGSITRRLNDPDSILGGGTPLSNVANHLVQRPGHALNAAITNGLTSPLGSAVANTVVYGEDFSVENVAEAYKDGFVGAAAAGAARGGNIGVVDAIGLGGTVVGHGLTGSSVGQTIQGVNDFINNGLHIETGGLDVSNRPGGADTNYGSTSDTNYGSTSDTSSSTPGATSTTSPAASSSNASANAPGNTAANNSSADSQTSNQTSNGTQTSNGAQTSNTSSDGASQQQQQSANNSSDAASTSSPAQTTVTANNGTTTVNSPDGTSVTISADNTTTVTAADGTTMTTGADGTRTATSSDGTSVVIGPDGTYTVIESSGATVSTQDGVTTIQAADGGTTVVAADGSSTITAADGTTTVSEVNGTTTVTSPNGTTTVTTADGTTTVTAADGTVTVTSPDGTTTSDGSVGTVNPSETSDGTAATPTASGPTVDSAGNDSDHYGATLLPSTLGDAALAATYSSLTSDTARQEFQRIHDGVRWNASRTRSRIDALVRDGGGQSLNSLLEAQATARHEGRTFGQWALDRLSGLSENSEIGRQTRAVRENTEQGMAEVQDAIATLRYAISQARSRVEDIVAEQQQQSGRRSSRTLGTRLQEAAGTIPGARNAGRWLEIINESERQLRMLQQVPDSANGYLVERLGHKVFGVFRQAELASESLGLTEVNTGRDAIIQLRGFGEVRVYADIDVVSDTGALATTIPDSGILDDVRKADILQDTVRKLMVAGLNPDVRDSQGNPPAVTVHFPDGVSAEFAAQIESAVALHPATGQVVTDPRTGKPLRAVVTGDRTESTSDTETGQDTDRRVAVAGQHGARYDRDPKAEVPPADQSGPHDTDTTPEEAPEEIREETREETPEEAPEETHEETREESPEETPDEPDASEERGRPPEDQATPPPLPPGYEMRTGRPQRSRIEVDGQRLPKIGLDDNSHTWSPLSDNPDRAQYLVEPQEFRGIREDQRGPLVEQAARRQAARDALHEAGVHDGPLAAALNTESERLGEQAGKAYINSRYAVDGTSLEPVFTGSGSATLDQVWQVTLPDGGRRVVVVEAKGGASTLGTRDIGRRTVQQGRPEYLSEIADLMRKSADPAERAAGQLVSDALVGGLDIDYLHVHAVPVSTSDSLEDSGTVSDVRVLVGSFDLSVRRQPDAVPPARPDSDFLADLRATLDQLQISPNLDSMFDTSNDQDLARIRVLVDELDAAIDAHRGNPALEPMVRLLSELSEIAGRNPALSRFDPADPRVLQALRSDPDAGGLHPLSQALIALTVETALGPDAPVLAQLNRVASLDTESVRTRFGPAAAQRLARQIADEYTNGLFDPHPEVGAPLIRLGRSVLEVAVTLVHESTHAGQPTWQQESGAFSGRIALENAPNQGSYRQALLARRTEREIEAFLAQREFLLGLAAAHSPAGVVTAVPPSYQWLVYGTEADVRSYVEQLYALTPSAADRFIRSVLSSVHDGHGGPAEAELHRRRGPPVTGSQELSALRRHGADAVARERHHRAAADALRQQDALLTAWAAEATDNATAHERAADRYRAMAWAANEQADAERAATRQLKQEANHLRRHGRIAEANEFQQRADESAQAEQAARSAAADARNTARLLSEQARADLLQSRQYEQRSEELRKLLARHDSDADKANRVSRLAESHAADAHVAWHVRVRGMVEALASLGRHQTPAEGAVQAALSTVSDLDTALLEAHRQAATLGGTAAALGWDADIARREAAEATIPAAEVARIRHRVSALSAEIDAVAGRAAALRQAAHDEQVRADAARSEAARYAAQDGDSARSMALGRTTAESSAAQRDYQLALAQAASAAEQRLRQQAEWLAGQGWTAEANAAWQEANNQATRAAEAGRAAQQHDQTSARAAAEAQRAAWAQHEAQVRSGWSTAEARRREAVAQHSRSESEALSELASWLDVQRRGLTQRLDNSAPARDLSDVDRAEAAGLANLADVHSRLSDVESQRSDAVAEARQAIDALVPQLVQEYAQHAAVSADTDRIADQVTSLASAVDNLTRRGDSAALDAARQRLSNLLLRHQAAAETLSESAQQLDRWARAAAILDTVPIGDTAESHANRLESMANRARQDAAIAQARIEYGGQLVELLQSTARVTAAERADRAAQDNQTAVDHASDRLRQIMSDIQAADSRIAESVATAAAARSEAAGHRAEQERLARASWADNQQSVAFGQQASVVQTQSLQARANAAQWRQVAAQQRGQAEIERAHGNHFGAETLHRHAQHSDYHAAGWDGTAAQADAQIADLSTAARAAHDNAVAAARAATEAGDRALLAERRAVVADRQRVEARNQRIGLEADHITTVAARRGLLETRAYHGMDYAAETLARQRTQHAGLSQVVAQSRNRIDARVAGRQSVPLATTTFTAAPSELTEARAAAAVAQNRVQAAVGRHADALGRRASLGGRHAARSSFGARRRADNAVAAAAARVESARAEAEPVRRQQDRAELNALRSTPPAAMSRDSELVLAIGSALDRVIALEGRRDTPQWTVQDDALLAAENDLLNNLRLELDAGRAGPRLAAEIRQAEQQHSRLTDDRVQAALVLDGARAAAPTVRNRLAVTRAARELAAVVRALHVAQARLDAVRDSALRAQDDLARATRALPHRISARDTAAFTAHSTAAHDRVRGLRTQLAELDDQISGADSRAATFQDRINELAADLAAADQELAAATDALVALRSSAAPDAEALRAALERFQDAERQYRAIPDDIQDAHRELAEIRAEQEALATPRADLVFEIEIAEAAEAGLHPVGSARHTEVVRAIGAAQAAVRQSTEDTEAARVEAERAADHLANARSGPDAAAVQAAQSAVDSAVDRVAAHSATLSDHAARLAELRTIRQAELDRARADESGDTAAARHHAERAEHLAVEHERAEGVRQQRQTLGPQLRYALGQLAEIQRSDRLHQQQAHYAALAESADGLVEHLDGQLSDAKRTLAAREADLDAARARVTAATTALQDRLDALANFAARLGAVPSQVLDSHSTVLDQLRADIRTAEAALPEASRAVARERAAVRGFEHQISRASAVLNDATTAQSLTWQAIQRLSDVVERGQRLAESPHSPESETELGEEIQRLHDDIAGLSRRQIAFVDAVATEKAERIASLALELTLPFNTEPARPGEVPSGVVSGSAHRWATFAEKGVAGVAAGILQIVYGLTNPGQQAYIVVGAVSIATSVTNPPMSGHADYVNARVKETREATEEAIAAARERIAAHTVSHIKDKYTSTLGQMRGAAADVWYNDQQLDSVERHRRAGTWPTRDQVRATTATYAALAESGVSTLEEAALRSRVEIAAREERTSRGVAEAVADTATRLHETARRRSAEAAELRQRADNDPAATAGLRRDAERASDEARRMDEAARALDAQAESLRRNARRLAEHAALVLAEAQAADRAFDDFQAVLNATPTAPVASTPATVPQQGGRVRNWVVRGRLTRFIVGGPLAGDPYVRKVYWPAMLGAAAGVATWVGLPPLLGALGFAVPLAPWFIGLASALAPLSLARMRILAERFADKVKRERQGEVRNEYSDTYDEGFRTKRESLKDRQASAEDRRADIRRRNVELDAYAIETAQRITTGLPVDPDAGPTNATENTVPLPRISTPAQRSAQARVGARLARLFHREQSLLATIRDVFGRAVRSLNRQNLRSWFATFFKEAFSTKGPSSFAAVSGTAQAFYYFVYGVSSTGAQFGLIQFGLVVASAMTATAGYAAVVGKLERIAARRRVARLEALQSNDRYHDWMTVEDRHRTAEFEHAVERIENQNRADVEFHHQRQDTVDSVTRAYAEARELVRQGRSGGPLPAHFERFFANTAIPVVTQGGTVAVPVSGGPVTSTGQPVPPNSAELTHAVPSGPVGPRGGVTGSVVRWTAPAAVVLGITGGGALVFGLPFIFPAAAMGLVVGAGVHGVVRVFHDRGNDAQAQLRSDAIEAAAYADIGLPAREHVRRLDELARVARDDRVVSREIDRHHDRDQVARARRALGVYLARHWIVPSDVNNRTS